MACKRRIRQMRKRHPFSILCTSIQFHEYMFIHLQSSYFTYLMNVLFSLNHSREGPTQINCVCVSVRNYLNAYISETNYNTTVKLGICWKFGPIGCVKISLCFATQALRYVCFARNGSNRLNFFFFFLHFYAFQSISSRLRHTFFQKLRASEASKMKACWSN